MGVLGTLTAISGIVGATSQITAGIAEKRAAESNAAIFDMQAANIQTQKGIIAEQYQTKTKQLEGTAVATAAHQGVKISGSVAQSISQSITQLGIEQSYEQYNLNAERQKALEQAEFQRMKGRQAMTGGLLNAGTTALTSATTYYSKYWGKGIATSANKLVGDFNTGSYTGMRMA